MVLMTSVQSWDSGDEGVHSTTSVVAQNDLKAVSHYITQQRYRHTFGADKRKFGPTNLQELVACSVPIRQDSNAVVTQNDQGIQVVEDDSEFVDLDSQWPHVVVQVFWAPRRENRLPEDLICLIGEAVFPHVEHCYVSPLLIDDKSRWHTFSIPIDTRRRRPLGGTHYETEFTGGMSAMTYEWWERFIEPVEDRMRKHRLEIEKKRQAKRKELEAAGLEVPQDDPSTLNKPWHLTTPPTLEDIPKPEGSIALGSPQGKALWAKARQVVGKKNGDIRGCRVCTKGSCKRCRTETVTQDYR